MTSQQNDWDTNNKSIQWDDFNAIAYQKHWFGGKLETEDKWSMLALATRLREQVPLDSIEHAVDIGTGSSFVLPLAIAPYVKHLDLIEPGKQNVAYLQATLKNKEKLERDWQQTIQCLQEFDGDIYGNVAELLMERAVVYPNFAQDILEKDKYSALTMGFCAGSNSDNPDETAQFMRIVLDSVKPGSLYAAMHTLNSGPYPDWSTNQGEVDMGKFPSLKASQSWYAKQYKGTGIELHKSPMTQMRPDYDGTLLALGFTTEN
jgi:hypothetical protein